MTTETMTKDEADARSIRTNINRSGGRLAFRQKVYRGEAGISLSGRDALGRSVRMFAPTWAGMIGLMLRSYVYEGSGRAQ